MCVWCIYSLCVYVAYHADGIGVHLCVCMYVYGICLCVCIVALQPSLTNELQVQWTIPLSKHKVEYE